MNRLGEALDAYDAVIRDNLGVVIAKTGRVGVLAAMGRYDVALQGLPEVNPQTASEWIGYHIRGMIMLRRG